MEWVGILSGWGGSGVVVVWCLERRVNVVGVVRGGRGGEQVGEGWGLCVVGKGVGVGVVQC
ncbi:hypothetical protein DPMN_067151 [Dreissena polymorpha]|uniref:Uncharacterized protein n=1 Tax=Dreissena polymorpha TaxID=45954 RepID=A0A9D3YXI7_DREPO|nr:hypothetical protein DPMN_067151 [Dreissena polymorpha]